MAKLKYGSIVFISLMAGCASQKPITETSSAIPAKINAPIATHKAQMSALTSWHISGAMAAKNKHKGWTASVDWQQHGLNQYQIRLFGPLANGAVMIAKNKGVVTYTDGPKTVSAANADELLQKTMGMRIPVNNLYYWVRGIPAPGAVQAAHYDQNNHLVFLKQNGFNIDYANYTSVNGYDLPGKIHLQGNQVSMKLLVKKWTLQ